MSVLPLGLDADLEVRPLRRVLGLGALERRRLLAAWFAQQTGPAALRGEAMKVADFFIGLAWVFVLGVFVGAAGVGALMLLVGP